MNTSTQDPLQALELKLKNLQEYYPTGIPSSPDAKRAADLERSALEIGNLRLGLADFLHEKGLADDEALLPKLHGLQVDALTWAIKLTPQGHKDLVLRLLWLADTLLERYQRYGRSLSDLQLATTMVDRVSLIISQSHEMFPDFLLNFARTCLARFESTPARDIAELDKAITQMKPFQSVVDRNPELLQLYANILLNRFRKTDSPGDLTEGIEKSEMVTKDGKAPLPTKRYAFSNLAECYKYLYDLQPNEEKNYLDHAVENGMKAAELVDEGAETAGTAFVFGTLAKAFFDRFYWRRQEDDLLQAIENGKKAIKLSDSEDLDKAKWIDNLGLAYDVRFEDTGDICDLQEAIDLLEKAVDLSPKNTPSAQRSTNNLANALSHRFEWTGDTESLDLAIEKLQFLVDNGNWSEVERANCLQNLASSLFQRHMRQSKPEDLNEAVERLTEALNKFPDGHTDVASASSLLCSILATRKQDKDILNAIKYGEQALSLKTQDDPYAATFFRNLAQAYKIKWEESGAGEDLKMAISHSNECIQIQMTPLDSQHRAYQLFSHGSLVMTQVLTQDATIGHYNLAEPLRLFKEAAELHNGVPLVRIVAARNAIRILHELKDWEGAKSLGLTAMELLPLVCSRYLTLEDQQQAIFQTSGLAADVCSLLLQVDDPELALLKLETGRAILLGYVMDDHDDLVTLKEHHRDGLVLAQRFEELRDKLRIPPDLRGSRLGDVKLRERRAAEVAINECLREIRQNEGHEGFLRGLSVDGMKACSKEGPIVIVNVTYIRSDAILILDSKIRVVPLPNLQLKDAAEFGFGSYLRDSPWHRDAKVIWSNLPKQPSEVKFLEWLWNTCVKAVCEELKACNNIVQSAEVPRVWWIGSGAAAGFPFHAARSETDQDALSLMIPSYTPSIKALTHSRQRSHGFQGRNQTPKLTIVTMGTTPGHKSLPGVFREKEAIEEVCEKVYNCKELHQPDVNAVLKTMVESDVIHFACHGMANFEDPSQSHLLLEKVTKNGREVDKLTVSRMLSLGSVQQAWVAYLSACSTASMRASRLADEGLHTSGAFQIAGFAHVIGSLWPVEDEICVDVARVFYEYLIKAQGKENRTVAAALRQAVLHIRQQHPLSWRKWGAYIHSGA